jgi:hypothetical protein
VIGGVQEYFLYRDGQQHGPISAGEFGVLVQGRHVRPDDLIWFNGISAWTKAQDIPGLLNPPNNPSPPPPVAPAAPYTQTAPARASHEIAPSAAIEPVRRETVAKVPGGAIFISYRRGDARHAAGRLVDRLAQTYSSEQLFLDTDSIEPGLDFVQVLTEKVEACDVLLAIIGRDWLDARNIHGERRLDNPADFVRIEIEAALNRDVRVIPVLVDGATMPSAAELPPSLARLSTRNAVRLEHERFGADAEGLIRALTRIVPPKTKSTAPALNMGPVPRAAFAAPIVPDKPAVQPGLFSKPKVRSSGAAATEASGPATAKLPVGNLALLTLLGTTITIAGAYLFAFAVAQTMQGNIPFEPFLMAAFCGAVLLLLAKRHWQTMPWTALITWAVLLPAASVAIAGFVSRPQGDAHYLIPIALTSCMLLAAWIWRTSSAFELGLLWAIWSSVLTAGVAELPGVFYSWPSAPGEGSFRNFTAAFSDVLFNYYGGLHVNFYAGLAFTLAVGVGMAIRWWRIHRAPTSDG